MSGLDTSGPNAKQWDLYAEMVQKCFDVVEEKLNHARAMGKPYDSEFIDREYNKLDLQLQRQMMTNGMENMAIHFVFPKPGYSNSAPPPFQEMVEAHLQFYCTYLEPFLHTYKDRPDNTCLPLKSDRDIDDANDDQIPKGKKRTVTSAITTRYLSLTHQICLPVSAVRQRYSKGLLRENQIKLVKIAMKSHLDTLKLLIEAEEDQTTTAAVKLVNVYAEVLRQWYLMAGLVNAVDFRSERLELLLVRYICDDFEDVNRELVSALDQIHLDNLPEECVQSFPVIKKVNPDMTHRSPTVAHFGINLGFSRPNRRELEMREAQKAQQAQMS